MPTRTCVRHFSGITSEPAVGLLPQGTGVREGAVKEVQQAIAETVSFISKSAWTGAERSLKVTQGSLPSAHVVFRLAGWRHAYYHSLH